MTAALLHVQQFGDPAGSPVLALHGLRGHGGRWRALTEQHLTGLCVYGPDLRGHGKSSWLRPWTLEQHTADVVATMDDLGLAQVDMLGYSFGGAVALSLARHVPERVHRLMLLDPSVGMMAAAYAAEAARAALAAPLFADPADARAARARSWPLAPAALVDKEVNEHLARGEDGCWRWQYDPSAVAEAYWQMVRPCLTPPADIPTLLVRARRSALVPPDYLAACGEDALVAVREVDCSHLILIERPSETGALIQEFLAA